MAETRSTCPYCGVGCGVLIKTEGTRITDVRGDPEHPANFGRLCSKGSTLHLTATDALRAQTRLLRPQQRSHRGASPEAVEWDSALNMAADRFAHIITQHGPDAVGFYVSGQLLTEDYYVFNKLAKGLVGTNNIDTNSRLCMSSAVAGYKLTLGADAPPTCYDDVNHAGCLFFAGSNTAWAHPVLFRRIEEARAANPAMKVIVADPRRTETAAMADLFLPLQPGTDVMLFHGMLHTMLWEGWVNTEYIDRHTTGFPELKALVREATPEHTAQICGLRKEDIRQAAQWFAQSGPTLSLYCQGLNQSVNGTAKNAALINLHLATGQIGKPGAGPFSLTGQPNAMGGREVGGLANLLSAHRDLSSPTHRAEVAALWGLESVPAQPGKTAVEMFQAAADGEIKALWIACTNPAQSLPNQSMVRRALERAEFVVVQEAFATTATCAFADLLLPATTWGEKEGTVTNSERRISRVRPAVPPPGDTRHDWLIAMQFAQRLEKLLHPGRPTLFPYEHAEQIWGEHRESTRGRDLDITGLSWAMLDESGPQQWPLKEGSPTGLARLYEDGQFPTPDGRARFSALPWQPVAEPRDARHPFSLTTGRLRDQWHGMSRTGQIGRLFGHVPEPCLQMHPQDMARRALSEGDLVHITNRRGAIIAPVQADEGLALSQVFMAMHWGGEYLSGKSSIGERLAGVNTLTTPAFCPQSKQPEFKHTSVKLLKAELPWTLLGMAWLPEAQATREAMAALMSQFDFASCVPFSSQTTLEDAHQARHGVLLRAAAYEAPDAALVQRIEALLGLSGPEVLRYADKRRQQSRSVRLAWQGKSASLEALLLAGDASAGSWLTTLLKESLPAQTYGRLLLMPGNQLPAAMASRGKQICTCFNVDEPAITSALSQIEGDDTARLQQLQAQLRCGTNCGSCVPALKQLITKSAKQSATI
ncbi:nitrate reductase [Ottowia thiooxydans]|uniref:nitrate reductase n=1 Tax=Ottowia thiooxydans TaxID=219182 RepID=UPI0004246FC3|nr:nitrate reductase [Ottowia thiooxydans]